MSYKTLKRRQQRKKAIFVKAKRKRWIQQLRDEAFEAWKKTWLHDTLGGTRLECLEK